MTVSDVARAHAVLAWAATLALGAAAFAAFSPARLARLRARAPAMTAAGAALGAGAFGTGLALEAPWRLTRRLDVFVRAPALGWWFERKEHLAFAAVALAWAAVFLRAGSSVARGPSTSEPLAMGASRAAVAAALLAAVVSAVGSVVARRFPM